MDIRFQLHHRSGFRLEELAAKFYQDFKEELNGVGLNENDAEDWFEVEHSYRLPTGRLLSTIRLRCDIVSLTNGNDFADVFLTNLPDFQPARIDKVVCIDNLEMRQAAQVDQAIIYRCEMQIREILYHILIVNDKFETDKQGKENIANHLTGVLGAMLKSNQGSERKSYENELFYLMFDDYKKLKPLSLPHPEKIIDLIDRADSYSKLRTFLDHWGIGNPRHKDFINAVKEPLEKLHYHRNNVMHNRSSSVTRTKFDVGVEQFNQLVARFWTAEQEDLASQQLSLLGNALKNQLQEIVKEADIHSGRIELRFSNTIVPNFLPRLVTSQASLLAVLEDFSDQAIEFLAPIQPGQADEVRADLNITEIIRPYAQHERLSAAALPEIDEPAPIA
ncbi:hypothetical protein HHL22_11890 [Hymenobacter sp. RP-2-7]|uniref:Uncharacterized protein n=1 Tax=Hymenobacter polaris TaxID=2682546 RepID=A0A7Y0FMJ0_9BACT|nr:hypothetical protein [Hymenobacter polaris]NML65907.1 hypothetical protein [Hymenobacter polaris]